MTISTDNPELDKKMIIENFMGKYQIISITLIPLMVFVLFICSVPLIQSSYRANADFEERVITVGSGPAFIAYNPGNQKMYVTNFGTCPSAGAPLGPTIHPITIIDKFYNAKSYDISEDCPEHITYNPSNDKMYVTNWGDDTVSVIDDTRLVANVDVDDGPIGIAYNPINNRMYVANSDDDDVQVFSSNTNCCTQEIEFDDTSPVGLAFNPTNNKMYVTNFATASVSAIDINGDFDTIQVGNQPTEIAYNPSNHEMFVVNLQDNTVSVIDGTTVKNVIHVGHSPHGIAYNEDNGRMYVSNGGDGTVSVINDTMVLGRAIKVGNNPVGIAYNPIDKKMYVVNRLDDTVSVIQVTGSP